MRLVLSPYADLSPAALASAYRQVPGVTAALPVIRGAVDVGRAITGAPLVAVNADRAAAVATFPADASGGSLPGLLDQLGAARAADAGLALQGSPLRLGVTIDAHFTAPDGFPQLPASAGGVLVTAVVITADGFPQRFSGPAALLEGVGQRVEIPLGTTVGGTTVGGTTAPSVGPLRIESLEVAISPSTDAPVFGTVDLRGLSESQSASAQDWTGVPFDPGASGWKWVRSDELGIEPYRPPTGSPGQIRVGADEIIFRGNPLVTYRFTAPQPDAPVPGLAGRHFLEQSGAAVGDTLSVEYSFLKLDVRVLGVTDEFPTLDPRSRSW